MTPEERVGWTKLVAFSRRWRQDYPQDGVLAEHDNAVLAADAELERLGTVETAAKELVDAPWPREDSGRCWYCGTVRGPHRVDCVLAVLDRAVEVTS